MSTIAVIGAGYVGLTTAACFAHRAAAAEMGPSLEPEAIVVNKSTVPVGSTRVVEEVLGRDDVSVVSNPEFLREGSAVHDSLNPVLVVRHPVNLGKVIDDITVESDRFGLEPEMTAEVLRRGYRVYEVPVSYSGRAASEGCTFAWRDGVRALSTLARYRWGAVR